MLATPKPEWQSSKPCKWRHCCSGWFSLFFLLLTLPAAAMAQTLSLEQAAGKLADRLAAIPNFHGPVRLEFLGQAAAFKNAEENWKATLRQELESRRVTVSEETSAPVLRVAITQTPTQIAIAGSAVVGDRQELRIVTVSRAAVPTANLPVAPVRLERQLIYQTPDRILDATVLWNGEEKGLAVLLLRNSELSASLLDSAGVVKQSVSLAGANPRLPRDPRVELLPEGAQFELRLPAKICEFSWTSTTDLKCRAARYNGREPTVLTSPCDSSEWKLQTDGKDWTTSDLLQAVPSETSEEGSAAVMSEFAGPVLGINGEQNPSNALVVIRNLRTGNYEVYKITLACGD